MEDSMLTYDDIARETGITTRALRKRLSTGTMPPPDVRHGSSPVWYRSTLAAWLATAKPGK